MALEVILLGTGFLLAVILLILLIMLAREGITPQRKKVKEDIKKIKKQVNGQSS